MPLRTNLQAIDVPVDEWADLVQTMIRIAKSTGRFRRDAFAFLGERTALEAALAERRLGYQRVARLADEASDAHHWLIEKLNGRNPALVLMARSTPRASANLTCWYQQKLLPASYLAVSPHCRAVIHRLDAAERALLPAEATLQRFRTVLATAKQLVPAVARLFDLLTTMTVEPRCKRSS